MSCLHCNSFQSFMEINNIPPETISYLLEQGIECERIRLQVQEATESDTLNSHIKLLQGERFLALLTSACTGG